MAVLTREDIITRLGRKVDPYRPTDYRFPASPAAVRAYVPPTYSSVLKWAGPIMDQLNYGSCVFNAITSNMETLLKKHGLKFFDFSRFFLYWVVRKQYVESGEIGSINEDSGAMISDGMSAAKKVGVCSEALWTYIDGHFAKRPTAACFTEALKYQVLSYFRIDTLAQMKYQIAERRSPFVMGMDVYESFEEIGRDGRMPMPVFSREEILGGHAMMAVGYNDKFKNLDGSLGAFLVQNSWGDSWGLGGRLWIPYKYMGDIDHVQDNWGITKGELI